MNTFMTHEATRPPMAPASIPRVMLLLSSHMICAPPRQLLAAGMRRRMHGRIVALGRDAAGQHRGYLLMPDGPERIDLILRVQVGAGKIKRVCGRVWNLYDLASVCCALAAGGGRNSAVSIGTPNEHNGSETARGAARFYVQQQPGDRACFGSRLVGHRHSLNLAAIGELPGRSGKMGSDERPRGVKQLRIGPFQRPLCAARRVGAGVDLHSISLCLQDNASVFRRLNRSSGLLSLNSQHRQGKPDETHSQNAHGGSVAEDQNAVTKKCLQDLRIASRQIPEAKSSSALKRAFGGSTSTACRVVVL